MSAVERLLGEFAHAWSAGERPRVDDFLARSPEAERTELAADLHAFLAHAPAPALSDAAREEVRAEPLARALLDSGPAGGGWPELLPLLRRRARLRRDHLVEALAERLGTAGAEAKVGRYYHRMEAGTLAPEGVSRRVLDALARLLGVARDELEGAARAGDQPAGPAVAFARSALVDFAVAHDAAPAALGSEAWDEVDELFLGGR